MVTGSKGYSAGKVRKLRAARTAVAKAATLLRSRSGGNLRAPLATYGWYGRYNRRGRTELKTVDTAVSQTVSNSGTVTLINGIAQGNDFNNRDGRICNMKSVYWRYSVSPNSSTTTLNQGDSVRVMIVYDMQSNGTAANIAQLFAGADCHSAMNLNYRDRFKVLYDKSVNMAAGAYTATALTVGSPTTKTFNVYKKLDLETVFQSTGSGVADISTGSMFLITWGLANQASVVIGYMRVRFTDK